MKKLTIAAALAAATMLASPACAGDNEGKIQVKLLGTGVLPDGKITNVNSIAPTLATNPVFAAPQSFASDNVVPTVAIEYFFSPNVSLETICCTTKHHVNGSGSLAGTNLVNDVLIVPATFTLKYHLPLGAIKPYVGAGPAVFLMLDSKPGVTATALGVTRAKLSTEIGVAVQAGVDVPLGDSGFGITLDAKKYWINTTAKFYAGTTNVLETKHKLDPWVLSGGVSYRF
ncbi:MAG: OmpW family protein [Novosphingobium sp.]|uniref:OmpW/AlkL family protein n=1 Tax=Novosphingobium sp. TaxID=1874826 RepID=UPI00185C6AF3|nr:OmpW family protein [Novosphingobium sp.]